MASTCNIDVFQQNEEKLEAASLPRRVSRVKEEGKQLRESSLKPSKNHILKVGEQTQIPLKQSQGGGKSSGGKSLDLINRKVAVNRE